MVDCECTGERGGQCAVERSIDRDNRLLLVYVVESVPGSIE
jgi:hypothetical protein